VLPMSATRIADDCRLWHLTCLNRPLITFRGASLAFKMHCLDRGKRYLLESTPTTTFYCAGGHESLTLKSLCTRGA
jgi:hypothetical protein